MTYSKLNTVFLSIFLFISLYIQPAFSDWIEISPDNNRLALDGIWGSSEDNLFAISFDRTALRCTGDCNLEEGNDWENISDLALKADVSGFQLHPLGIWGIDENNVYIVGGKVDTDKTTPFIMKYSGGDSDDWSKITVPDLSGLSTHPPLWFTSVWGTAPDNLYFIGSNIVQDQDGNDIDSGSIWHYDGVSFTEEVGAKDVGLIDDSPYDYVLIPQMFGITGHDLGGGDVELFVAGLKSLILHKNTANVDSPDWKIMVADTSLINDQDDARDKGILNFFRLWSWAPADSAAERVMAVGFNNNTSKAVIYQYRENAWEAMSIPKTRVSFIPALWGVWGYPERDKYYAVGNEGAVLYLDTSENPENISWRQMVSGVGSSFNHIWGPELAAGGDEPETAYVSCEDGNVYYFDGTINRAGVVAVPSTGFEPLSTNFSDISVDKAIKWEWDFGEGAGTLDPVAATADIDYKLLLTAKPGALYNERNIRIDDNGNTSDTVLPPTYKVEEAIPPTATLAGNITITGITKHWLNGLTIVVAERVNNQTPAVVYDGDTLTVYVKSGETTHQETADALAGHYLIESASCKIPNTPWTGDDIGSETIFAGCHYQTWVVSIESRQIRQEELGDYIVRNIDWIESYTADNARYLWTVGNETYSNEATFSGGSDDPNFYTNEDLGIEYYYMANHTYQNEGHYEAKLTITRPDGEYPSTETKTVTIHVLPNELDFVGTPNEGTGNVDSVFSYTGKNPMVEGDPETAIVALNWHFGDTKLDTGSESVKDNPNSTSTDSPNSTVSHHYKSLGSYDVTLSVTLKNGSTLRTIKPKYIEVKSSDEDKHSWEGGAGCFIQEAAGAPIVF